MRKILLATVLSLSVGSALAGNGTINVTPGAGAVFDVVTDGSGNFLSKTVPCDGTAGANCAAVKAASTAAAATDPALVVAISPNNTVAVTQSGTWTVQPGNTANTTPWLVTGSGTAGTAASGVLTVQGIASMTPLLASQSGNWTARVVGNVGAVVDFAGQNASSPANAWLIGGQFNTTPTTLTSGNTSPLQLDSAGNLLVNIKAGAAAGGTSSNFAAAFPSAGTAIGVKNGANMVNLAADGSNNLNVNCQVGCSSSGGSSLADEGTFTQGTTSFTVAGGIFNNSITNLTSGQAGAVQLTNDRRFQIHVDDGQNVTLGAKADAVCGSATGTCTLQALTKFVANAVSSAIPTGSNTIGNVGQVASIPTTGTLQSAAVANGNGTNLSVNGMSSAILTINCSSCSGGTTVNFEGTEDNTNFTSVNAVLLGTNTIASSTTTSGITIWQTHTAGFQNLRARISAYSAGTITVTGHTVPVTFDPKVVNANIVANTATNQSVNLAQVGGASISLGQAAMASSLPIAIASNQGAIGTVNPTTAANWGVGATGSAVPVNGIFGSGQARSSEITAATNGNLTGLVTDLVGKLIVMPYANKENSVKGTTAAMTGTTSTQLIAAVASNKIYLTTLTCGNSHATVGTFVNVQDGSGGTTLWTIPAASVYGGTTLNLVPPIATTLGNGVFVADATTGANVICSGTGYSGT